MIKKSVFEDDLIAGMQRNLAESELQAGIESLPQAVDYINSAIDIFEELDMYNKADAAIKVLEKIAASALPSLQAIQEELAKNKFTFSDIRVLDKKIPTTDENIAIKARLSAVLRKLHVKDEVVENFFNISLMSNKAIIEYYNRDVTPHRELKTGDTIVTTAKLKKKLFNPKKIIDRHSPKNSKEMIKNLLENGTVFKFIFNDSNKSDDDSVEDVFDADVQDLEIDPTQDLDESFEEE